MPDEPPVDAALLSLLNALDAAGYGFVTPTPATHAIVARRPDKQEARDLRGVFGWSLPFKPEVIGPEILGLLRSADALSRADGLAKSRLRASRVEGRLFLHSAYPTDDEDAVFLGPDSYRFANLLKAELAGAREGLRVVDIGAGSGVGAVIAADLCPDARVTMTDINPKALRLARVAAAHAGHEITAVQTSGLDGQDGPFDVVVANPPYILGNSGSTYKDGGDMHGGRISLDWSISAMRRLAPGGRLILYTGSAIVGGADRLKAELGGAAAEAGCDFRYREIDPDVFGGTLNKPGYEEVERIAVVAAVAEKRA